MRFAHFIYLGDRTIITATNINRHWFNWLTNIIREHNRTKIDRQDFKSVYIGNINKLGCVGHDLGHCWNVFQRTITGGNIYHMRTI